jgi:CRP/FNR family transcriptional regulator, cyclic AMP receptor protein
MRTMIPLRIFAIISNLIFITYAGVAGVYPILILHSVLLPLNAWRLREMMNLVSNIRNAATGDLRIEWLKPFMTTRRCMKGEVLFRRGEAADEMFFTLSGRFRLNEIGVDVGTGQLLGELGLLAPENRRSQTLECTADGEVLTMTYDQLRQLFFQNPEFGFYFLRLTSRRLFENVARLEEDVAALRAGIPEAGLEPAAAVGGIADLTRAISPARPD